METNEKPPWRVMKIDLRESVSDALQGLLLEFGALGIQVIDDETRNVPDEPMNLTGRAEILATFSYTDGLEAAVMAHMNRVLTMLPETSDLSISWADLYAQDWVAEFKSHWQPVRLGPRIHIVPSWHEATYAPKDKDALLIYLDPGMAFGTGMHATTSLCAQALERHLKQQPILRLLDVGTGTGILSIIALHLGAKEALGTDIDPVAVRNSLENAERNNVLHAFSANEALPDQRGAVHDVVVANILCNPLLGLSECIAASMRPGATLYLSGLLQNQEAVIREAYEAQGLTYVRTQVQDDWILVQFQKGS